MNKPLLQLALDQIEIQEALEAASVASNYVDVIEIGTILAFSQGVKIVKELRMLYPKHILVCDLKTTDGGAILAKMAFEAGANWLTVSAAAHIATIASCKKIADQFGGEIQIEIYGNWTYEDANAWYNLGVKQCIYHRSRDAELSGIGWTDSDLLRMRKLSEIGLEVSITGGITPNDIKLFNEINAKSFIVGRALCGDNAKKAAEELRREIDKYW